MPDMGAKVKSLRMERGMTQEDVAQKLFVTRQTVSNWENGKSRPDYEQLGKLAELFEQELSTFLENTGRDVGNWSKGQMVSAGVLGVITALFLLSEVALKPYLRELQSITYNPFYGLAYRLTIQFWGAAAMGAFLLRILSWRCEIGLRRGRERNWCLGLAVGLTVLYYAGVPYAFYAPGGFPYLGLWNFYMDIRSGVNWPFLLVGALYFLGLNRKNFKIQCPPAP